MRRPILSLALAGVLAGVVALSSPAAAQTAPDGFLEEIGRQFEASARKLVSLAEAMPEETYGWAPMEGVMPVARVYMHIARYNYYYPETSLGVASPMGSAEYDRWEEGVTGKEEVVRTLSESMDHVRRVMEGLSDADLETTTRLYGRDVGQWAVLLQLVAHMNEHLGQSIAYARANHVVPPWSR